jgi:hypothetical protein
VGALVGDHVGDDDAAVGDAGAHEGERVPFGDPRAYDVVGPGEEEVVDDGVETLGGAREEFVGVGDVHFDGRCIEMQVAAGELDHPFVNLDADESDVRQQRAQLAGDGTASEPEHEH